MLTPLNPLSGPREQPNLATAAHADCLRVGSALAQQATPDISPVFQAIEEDLQGQYLLGYYPDDAARGSDFHRIEISLTAEAGRKLRVRALREEYNLNKR